MRYQSVFFDLDGTLTDPGEGIMNSVRHALRRLGEPIPAEATLRAFIGPPLADSFRDFCGLPEERAQTAIAYYREYFREKGIFENTLLPGIPAMLAALRQAGCRLILATSKPEVFAEQILVHFGLREYFSFVAGSLLDGGRSKKAEVIRHAMAACGIASPEGCLMVGDREHDVLGAAACGMDACGVLVGYGSREELLAAGARYIAERPADVCDVVLGN